MLHINPTKQTLRFDMRGVDYVVPSGGECDIPDAIVYGLATRKLPLVPAPPKPMVVQPAPQPTAQTVIAAEPKRK